jgi:phage terminase large subunit GpA-like protein
MKDTPEYIDVDYDYILGFIEGLAPTPLLTVSEWSDENRYLSSESSAEPGRWRTDRTPYLKKILDCLSPTSTYKKVVAQKASQQGFSEAGLNCIGTYMDISPCPIMYIMPTVNMAKGLSKSRLKPMIENCPTLNKKIRPARERDADNTVLEKSFAGGILILTGANSAAELASRPIRVLILDEVDRYPIDVDNEGSPMDLAITRTLTFGNRKIFILSTPTITGASAIENEIEDTDKQMFFVPLPCCGVPQVLEFEQLRWTPGKPSTVKYECKHCGGLTEERHKAKFLAAGEWIATEPEKSNKDTIGFIINGLYSPLGWLSWKDIVKEFEAAKEDTTKMKTFVNTKLGLPYAEKTDAPAWENLYNRREDYPIGIVPNEVVFLTSGVDVQRDRLEIEVVGWCPNKISYSIEKAVFIGDTAGKKVWQELREYLSKQFIKDDLTLLPIRMTCIDSGFNTAYVYDFCRTMDASAVVPIKGQDTQVTIIRPPKAVDTKRTGKTAGKVKVWHIGVSVIKHELYGWLRQEKIEGDTPPGYCHFPQYEPEYFKGLTAEQIELKVVKGYKKYQWVKKYERNEPLDMRVYARAAAAIIGIDRLTPKMWDKLKAGYTHKAKSKVEEPPAQPEPVKKKIKRKDKTDFWNR